MERTPDAAYVPVTPPERSAEAMGPAVEIVSAGNEVLLGDVVDTNSNWLCTQVTGRGGHVRRTVMLRDEVDAIAAELRSVLRRRPALVFTVGGLGPTTDDLTLVGVAAALGVPLTLHPEAERLVRERYAEFAARDHVPFSGMNEARSKMARLPEGATALVNPIGGAPGVLVELDEAHVAALDAEASGPASRPAPACAGTVVSIVCLPGVPAELKAIVEQSLDDVLAHVFGDACFDERTLLVETQDESAIAHVLAAVERAHPHVYVKSRAQRIGSARVNRITTAARGDDAASVAALLDPVMAELRAGIAAAGFATEEADGQS